MLEQDGNVEGEWKVNQDWGLESQIVIEWMEYLYVVEWGEYIKQVFVGWIGDLQALDVKCWRAQMCHHLSHKKQEKLRKAQWAWDDGMEICFHGK